MKTKPASSKSSRRVITAKVRAACVTDEEALWGIRAQDGCMGSILGQPFYSCRYLPGKKLSLPFKSGQTFSCLINTAVRIDDDQFKALAEMLLKNKMRYAICSGIDSERFSGLLTELLESGEYRDDGRTAIACSNEQEPIEEAMEYFALPSGIAPVNLLVTIGNERIYKTTLRVFTRVAQRMHETLSI
ncbi:MAG: hypothetical protein JXA52_05495 [Planctomycetes bacterium]|nr:hypothetical protein [Planctomycetota bacterium]